MLPLSPTGTRDGTETFWFPSAIGPGACQLDLEIVEGEYRVEAWTIDLAGNTSDVIAQSVSVDGGCSSSRPSSWLVVLGVLLFVRRTRSSHRA